MRHRPKSARHWSPEVCDQSAGSKPRRWPFSASTALISASGVAGRAVMINSAGSYLTMPDRPDTSSIGKSPTGLPTERRVPPATISNGDLASRAARTNSTSSIFVGDLGHQ